MALPIYTSAAFTGTTGVEVAANASVEVRSEADDSLVTLYSDRAGTVQINNPFQADQFGRFEFFANPNSDGWRITVTSGADSHMLRYQQPMGARAGQEVYAFRAHKNGTNQTGVTTATFVKVTFDTEEFDDGGFYDSANSKFQPAAAGKYRLSATVRMEDVADGASLVVAIYKNGSIYASTRAYSSIANADLYPSVSALVEANGSTDFFEVYVFHDHGSDRTINGNSQTTWFDGELI